MTASSFATERASPGARDNILRYTNSFVTHDAVPTQHEPPTMNALVGEFMVAFLLVFIASRTAVNSDFFYSSMACFAIGAQHEPLLFHAVCQ